jgi:hypothetical protein
MRTSELRQVHQREMSFQGGRRSHNAATITQTEKHTILMTMLEGEAYTAMQDQFKEELGRLAVEREAIDVRNRVAEAAAYSRWERAYRAWERAVNLLTEQEEAQEAAAEAAKEKGILPLPVEAVVYPAEPIHRVPPKLPPPDIPDIIDRAWAFLERTFKEVTPEVERAYMFFDHKAGRSTILTLSALEELCRLTNKPTEGRAVVGKAINALRRELQGHLEKEQLLWSPAQLTLAHVRQRALEIEEALRTTELELAPLALAKAAKGMGQLTVADDTGEDASVGEKRPRENGRDRRRRSDDGKEAQEKGQAYAVTAPMAANRSAFAGQCYNCHQKGHVKADCPQL